MTEIRFSVAGLNLDFPFYFHAEVEVNTQLLYYVTTEGAGAVEVCAQITRGSIDCDIRATLASTDGPKAGTSVAVNKVCVMNHAIV